ncbi:MAG: agmatinase [Bacteroidales bacterium]|nr:MAG: agmatinase [Bacteroidales bacterium]
MENFAGLKGAFVDYDESKFFVLPVPYSTPNDWNPMAKKGAEAIVAASQYLEYYDTETRRQVWQKGIHTLEALPNLISDEKVVEAVEGKVADIFRLEKFPVVIGGNRTVSIGSVRAASKHFDDLTVVQFGAHNSMRVSYQGADYAPKCAMYHIKKHAPLIQIGIRSMGAEGQRNLDPTHIFFARDIYFDPNNRWFTEVYESLSANTYITLDLDVLDPSVMPSVSVPEPGGLQYFTLLRILKELFRRTNVVGIDIVGLCPNANNISPDYLAARLVYQMMTYKAVYSYGL